MIPQANPCRAVDFCELLADHPWDVLPTGEPSRFHAVTFGDVELVVEEVVRTQNAAHGRAPVHFGAVEVRISDALEYRSAEQAAELVASLTAALAVVEAHR